LMEFERLCSSTGPTEGQLVKRDGSVPQRIAVLHCVGREQLGYCSGICCQAAFKVPILAEHKIEGSEVTHLHTDLVSPGFAGATMQRKAAKRAQFVQLGDPEQTRVEAADEGLRVSYQDSAGEMQSTMVDMVVLASGLMPHRSTANVAQMLDLTCNDAGFVAADHPILRPAQSSVDGIYIAGCASGPKGIGESVGQAHAAAGMALSRIQPGRKLQLEVMTASSDASLCSGCMMCVSVCPYRACSRDQETGRCELNDALCHGCGTCVATCPSGAAEARQFTDQQLSAEIEEVLHG